MKQKQKIEQKKQQITERFDADCNRLYGSLDEAIRYLTEIRDKYQGTDISLDEHWTGYEDMAMTFCFTREETDEEFAKRLEKEEIERHVRERAEAQRKARERDLAEYKRLKNRLGI